MRKTYIKKVGEEFYEVREERMNDVDGNEVVLARQEEKLEGATKKSLTDECKAIKKALKDNYDAEVAKIDKEIADIEAL